jgi:hypothetical protein
MQGTDKPILLSALSHQAIFINFKLVSLDLPITLYFVINEFLAQKKPKILITTLIYGLIN